MCGISGLIDFTFKSDYEGLKTMTNVLQHRGPDAENYVILQNEFAQVGLGHKRLSIIDLSSNANQPMSSEDKNYWIVFNGEIYNFKETRKELELLNYKFYTNSDTEVVLKSYIEWGCNAVHKFIGMFAFALYDKIKNKIFLFRDRPGVKPLYYYFNNELLLFSSEIKSFHKDNRFKKEIDTDSVAMFFRHGYIHSPYTIYRKTKKIIPGHYLEVDIEKKKIEEIKYWDVLDHYNKPKLTIDYNEAKSHLKSLLISAFKYRLVADVPVGIFLSSGFDSSTVAAILAAHSTDKIKTYTIGFHDNRFDEAIYAEKIARYLGTDHTTLYCDIKHLDTIIRELPYYYDEPFGDSSAIPSILVSKIARSEVKTALSADGGDELFAGYPKHYQHKHLYMLIGNLPCKARNILKPLEQLSRFRHREGLFSAKSYNEVLKARLETVVFNNNELSNMLKFKYNILSTPFDMFDQLNGNNDFINKLLAIDYKTYLENDILAKMDRATMSVGLEGREPFLDHRIIEFVAQLPSSFKLHKNEPKYILKDINRDYIPKELMHNKKMGFGGPVDLWIKNSLKKGLSDLIWSKSFPHDILNLHYIDHITKDFFNGSINNWYKIYQIFTFLNWYKYWH